MLSSGVLRCVALVRTDVSELISSPILVTLMIEALCSSEMSVLTRVAEDGILHSRSSENLKCYIALTGCTLHRRGNVFLVK
jgi:hypothetical protein